MKKTSFVFATLILSIFLISIVSSAPINGNVTGHVEADGSGIVSGYIEGDFEANISGVLTGGVPDQWATFSGAMIGDINGSMTGEVNYNGFDTLFAEIENSNESEYTYLMGYFAGEKGDFVGKIATQEDEIDEVDSIVISGGDSVGVGDSLQMEATSVPSDVEVRWSVWTGEGESYGNATIDEITGELTGIDMGNVVVIASALYRPVFTNQTTIEITEPTTVYVDDDYNETDLTHFVSIQDALDVVADNGVVYVSEGYYTDDLEVTPGIKIIGIGDVYLEGSHLIEFDDVLFDNINFIAVNSSNAKIITISSINNLTVLNSNFYGTNLTNQWGLNVGAGSLVDGLSIENSSFRDLTIGWYFAKNTNFDETSDNVKNVYAKNLVFKNNDMKGIYAEKLSNAYFEDITVEDNGNSGKNTGNGLGYQHSAGIDINLKAGEYHNIEFKNVYVRNNAFAAQFGGGMLIKARDDGSYSSNPATLDSFVLNGGEFEGNERGLRFGEPEAGNVGPLSITVKNVKFLGEEVNYNGTDGSTYGSFISDANAAVNAKYNYWGSDNETEINSSISGNVIYAPWYKTSAMNSFSISTTSDEFGQKHATQEDEISFTGEIEVIIPANISITGESSWDGTINGPTVKTAPSVKPSKSGYTSTVSKTVEVGFTGAKLAFNKAVKITIPGEAGKKVGYSHDGSSFHIITSVCTGNNETWNTANLPAAGECYLNDGDDLVIWTKHFTEFVTYTETINPITGGGGGGSSSRSSSSTDDDALNESNETVESNATLEQSNETIEAETGEEESIITRGISTITGAVTGAISDKDSLKKTGFTAGGILIVILIIISNAGIPGTAYMSRARIFHKRASKAHIKGKYEKAKSLYEKSYSLREKGEKKAFGRSSNGSS